MFSERIKFSNYVFGKSISSLFVLPANAVKEKDKNLVSNLFLASNENKKYSLIFHLKR